MDKANTATSSKAPPTQLAHLTWPEVEAYLTRRTDVVVPIGSTEQHGPTGPMGTDYLCADAVARAVGERTGVLVAPPLPVGMALHHMAFPGTLSLKPSTLIAVIVDVVLSLAEHGFRRVLFINGHGGNVPTLRSGFAEAHAGWRARGLAQSDPLQLDGLNWWEGPSAKALLAELFGRADGYHATASELSMVQHVVPATQRPAPPDLPVPGAHGYQGAADFRAKHPDGRMGSDVRLADPAHGPRLIVAAVTDIAAKLAH